MPIKPLLNPFSTPPGGLPLGRRLLLLLLLLPFFLLPAQPGGAGAAAPLYAAAHAANSPASETRPLVLRLSGCSVSRTGYLEQLSAAFTQRTGIRVLLKGGGSMTGLLTLDAEASDLAASCLPPSADHVPASVRLVPVAGDALVFVTHRDNPVGDIGLEQVREIFLGQIDNWRQLGGPDRPLAVYLQYSRHGARGSGFDNHGIPFTLQQQVLDGRPIAVAPQVFFPRPSGGLVEESVARDPDGFTVSGFTSARIRPGLKMLAIDGIAASKENISSGAYPTQLHRHLYLGLADDAAPAARRFLAFALSPEGQQLISGLGAIALHELP
ncbi:substrate-binding domain-containing protein [Desulfurivibrio dismutans]|uniref:substrate-binding domain-containing protein n=1 Tax=Desulfurivibrio dismutans TaxID=1398908 RepID=UPI0023DB0812|nr:substrate-binding domain-containing protein [Desulfurivibrio alkaliphilus]MDF1613798.1 substrate-binding domain-containing protein [Desulfurivibrio alkaliphilus]